MEQVFAPLIPMFIGVGVARVGGEVIAATVRNRFIRALLLLALGAAWLSWHLSYLSHLLVK